MANLLCERPSERERARFNDNANNFAADSVRKKSFRFRWITINCVTHDRKPLVAAAFAICNESDDDDFGGFRWTPGQGHCQEPVSLHVFYAFLHGGWDSHIEHRANCIPFHPNRAEFG